MADQAHRQDRTPLLRTAFGAALRRNRLAQRRTLADVATRARVSVPYLSEVERGRKEASSEVLAAVCAALRIALPDLLTEAGNHLAAHPTDAPARAAGRLPAGQAAQPSAQVIAMAGVRRQRRRTPTTPVRRPGDVVLLAA